MKKTYKKEEIYHIGEDCISDADYYLPHVLYDNVKLEFKLYKSFENLGVKVGWAIYVYDEEARKVIEAIDFSKIYKEITKMSGMRYSVRKQLLDAFIVKNLG